MNAILTARHNSSKSRRAGVIQLLIALVFAAAGGLIGDYFFASLGWGVLVALIVFALLFLAWDTSAGRRSYL